MAKKVTFTISGDASAAANKWAVVGVTDKVHNTRLFRFVRSKQTTVTPPPTTDPEPWGVAFVTNHIATNESEHTATYWFLSHKAGNFNSISEDQKKYLLATGGAYSSDYDNRYLYCTDETTRLLTTLAQNVTGDGHYFNDGSPEGLIDEDFWVVVKIGNRWTSSYIASGVARNGSEIEIYFLI